MQPKKSQVKEFYQGWDVFKVDAHNLFQIEKLS